MAVASPDAHLAYRKRRRLSSLALLGALAVASVPIPMVCDRFDPRRSGEKPEQVLYLPRGDTLKYMTAGYNGVAADLVWIRSAMYVGRKVIRRERRYEWMEKLYLVTTDLDPHWTRPYHAGAILLSALPQDDERAMNLLRRGMRRNGWNIDIPFQAAQLNLLRGRRKQALRYLKLIDRCKPRPNATAGQPLLSPAEQGILKYVPVLIPALYQEGGDYRQAVKTSVVHLSNADDRVFREVGARGYREALSRLLTFELSGAANAYKQRFGRSPRDFAELKALASVRRQFVARLAPWVSSTGQPDAAAAGEIFELLPADPFGMKFYVRPRAGGVHSRGLERLELRRLLATLNHYLKLFKEARGRPGRDPREYVDFLRELTAAGKLRGRALEIFGNPPKLPPSPMGPGTWLGDSPASWRNMLDAESGQLKLPPGPTMEKMFAHPMPLPLGPKARARRAGRGARPRTR